MKRGAKLAVLLAALLILVGAWYLAASLSDRREAEQAEAAHADPVDISVGAAGDVTAIAWDYFGDAVNLSLRDGKWVNADDGACPIDQTAVEPLVEAVSAVAATDKITDVTNFDQYGLEESAFTVIAATADNIVTYQIGNVSPTGGAYVRMNGEDTVYVETGRLAQVFPAALDELLELETVPQDIDCVQALTVSTDAGGYALRRLDEAGEVWYTNASPWFLTNEQGEPVQPLDTDQTQALCDLAADLQLTVCADWNMQDPADYGLDEPQGTVQVDYLTRGGDPGSFSLSFGDYTDGDVYVRLDDSAMVYRVNGTVLDGLMYPDFEAMAPLRPCALDWDRLQSVTLRTDEEVYEIIHSLSTPVDGNEQSEDIYTLGDRSLDVTKVTAWLRQLYETPALSRTAATEGRQELFSLTFRQDSERFPEVTVQFRAYDSAHYLCVVNGEEYYLISRTEAESVKNKALEFLTELPA